MMNVFRANTGTWGVMSRGFLLLTAFVASAAQAQSGSSAGIYAHEIQEAGAARLACTAPNSGQAPVAPNAETDFITALRRTATVDSMQGLTAKVRLAGCLYQGLGVKPDLAAAYSMYREAGEISAEAAMMAAAMLYSGTGIEANRSEGAKAMKSTAALGYPPAVHWMASAFPTPETVEKSASMKDYRPMTDYAADLVYGSGVAANVSVGVAYLQRASDANFPVATYLLAKVYRKGSPGMPADNVRAVRLLKIAAEQGMPAAQYDLSGMYFNGEGMPQDRLKGVELVQKAANSDWPAAQYMMALLVQGGLGVAKNAAASLDWMRRAAAGGDDRAIQKLAQGFDGS